MVHVIDPSLIVDDNGNVVIGDGGASKVRAHKASGAQTIANNTATKVTFDTENFDTKGEFASSTFTAEVEGYYDVTGRVAWLTGDTDAFFFLYIYKSGLPVAESRLLSANIASAFTHEINDFLSLTAGQTIEIWVKQVTGGDEDIAADGGQTMISIRRRP